MAGARVFRRHSAPVWTAPSRTSNLSWCPGFDCPHGRIQSVPVCSMRTLRVQDLSFAKQRLTCNVVVVFMGKVATGLAVGASVVTVAGLAVAGWAAWNLKAHDVARARARRAGF